MLPRLLSLRSRPEFVLAVVTLALTVGLLFWPPIIGLADQGDFFRLMRPLGILYPAGNGSSSTPLFEAYVYRFYRLGAPGDAGYPSSTLAVLALAVAVNNLLHPGVFDLAVVGCLYAWLFSIGAFLIVRGLRRLYPDAPTYIVVAALGLVVFADVAYVSYFNSLYSEPTSFVFAFVAIGCALNMLASPAPSWAMLAGFIAAAAMLVTAKEQDLPVALLVAAFTLRLAWLHASRRWRLVSLFGVYLVLTLAVLATVAAPPAQYGGNLYDAVFDGVLWHATPQAASSYLGDFGLDSRYASLAGNPYYAPQSQLMLQDPAFRTSFFAKVSYTAITRFYVTHPGRLVACLDASAAAAMEMRPPYLGTYAQDSGEPPLAKSDRLALWSGLKAQWFPRSVWALLTFYAAYFAVALRAHRRACKRAQRLAVELWMLLGFLALALFMVPVLGDGTNELTKHLFLFNTFFDCTLLVAVAWLAQQLMRRVYRRSPSSAVRTTDVNAAGAVLVAAADAVPDN